MIENLRFCGEQARTLGMTAEALGATASDIFAPDIQTAGTVGEIVMGSGGNTMDMDRVSKFEQVDPRPKNSFTAFEPLVDTAGTADNLTMGGQIGRHDNNDNTRIEHGWQSHLEGPVLPPLHDFSPDLDTVGGVAKVTKGAPEPGVREDANTYFRDSFSPASPFVGLEPLPPLTQ